jgi:hypothetical protein
MLRKKIFLYIESFDSFVLMLPRQRVLSCNIRLSILNNKLRAAKTILYFCVLLAIFVDAKIPFRPNRSNC